MEQNINEIHRMQQLAWLINENQTEIDDEGDYLRTNWDEPPTKSALDWFNSKLSQLAVYLHPNQKKIIERWYEMAKEMENKQYK